MDIKCKIIVGVAALLMVTSCSSEYDLQGHDPKSYYAANPIKNEVETREAYFVLNFEPDSTRLSERGRDSMVSSLRSINPRSVDAIEIKVPARMAYRWQRVEHVKNLIRKSGLKKAVRVVRDSGLPNHSLVVSVEHVAVIAPHCPDWRKSPITTFSNTPASNFGCAATVNLGLMVDDPRDLVRGKDSRKINTERTSKVISDYRSGVDASAASGSESSSSSSSSK